MHYPDFESRLRDHKVGFSDSKPRSSSVSFLLRVLFGCRDCILSIDRASYYVAIFVKSQPLTDCARNERNCLHTARNSGDARFWRG